MSKADGSINEISALRGIFFAFFKNQHQLVKQTKKKYDVVTFLKPELYNNPFYDMMHQAVNQDENPKPRFAKR